jgi:translin
MHKLEGIANQIREKFDVLTKLRDQALTDARQLTRSCSLAIRAVHRNDQAIMEGFLNEARHLATKLCEELKDYPDLYHAGYTQDALKEFVEANVTCALILNKSLPTPEDLRVEEATYLNGLAEVPGELRRRILDILRSGYSEEVEGLLGFMDEIYSVLVTIDYPDAITNGLRRQTDLARGIIEKTRGDVTVSLQGQHLTSAIRQLSAQLNNGQPIDLEKSGLSIPRPEDD